MSFDGARGTETKLLSIFIVILVNFLNNDVLIDTTKGYGWIPLTLYYSCIVDIIRDSTPVHDRRVMIVGEG